MVNQKKIYTLNDLDISFSTDVGERDLTKISDIELDEAFAFLRAPFTGKFCFNLDNVNIMPGGLRKVYPFAYVEWLVDNFRTYMFEELGQKRGEQLNAHIFARELGDYSPEIMLCREGETEIVLPIEGDYSGRKISIYAVDFGKSVGKVSKEAIDLLNKNPRFRESKRLKNLTEVLDSITF